MDDLDFSFLIPEFLAEAREHLATLETGLLSLEAAPDNDSRAETINTLFRSAHTIKGSSRMLGYEGVGRVAHALEDVLGELRDKRLAVAAPLIDQLLRAVDQLRRMLDQPADYSAGADELIARLHGLLPADEPPAETSGSGDDLPPFTFEPAESLPAIDDTPIVAAVAPVTEVTPTALALPAIEPGHAPVAADETVRVAVSRLDELMRLTGEMMMGVQRAEELDRTNLALMARPRDAARPPDHASLDQIEIGRAELADSLRVLASTTKRLEEEVMTLRLLPLSTVFASLPRLVRDLAREHNKPIEFTLEGETTELDRRITQALSEPVMHVIRNAVDHGVEAPTARTGAGKPAVGQIKVRAYRQGERVRLEISDDGRGLSPGKLREAAVRKNLITAAEAAALDDTAALELIYLPGFSTASFITSTSGRGVGMEVVKASIARLGGSVELWTQPGVGTRFTFVLPLTVTLAHALLVKVSDRTYAIPAGAIERIIRLSPAEIQSSAGREHLLFEDHIIPLFRLSRLLGDSTIEPADCPALVMTAADQHTALAVDAVIDEREVVLKPLGQLLGRAEMAAGATLLPDGKVVFVLDPFACVRAARGVVRHAPARVESAAPSRRLLVVDDAATTRELERNILLASGYAVDTAVDGADGWRKLQTGSYALVITDVEMPNMTGFELTEAIRADARFAAVPVIIVTSLEQEREKRRGLAAGAQAYLIKSVFDQSTLLETIERLLP
ncbi:MAG: hybrid sensor histidine kinase/response regulator [Chloroflexi bacterium]|nr:hybrid sensor histidine kinase/response regulator [Chloroflexota bacterium]